MQKVRLGDVCTKGSSNIAQKDLEKKSGIYPIYGASGFIKNVDFYKQENEYIALVKDGAGVGRVMKCPEKSSVIGTMQYIFPNDNINISFLAYVLEKMDLSKFCSGATIPHIYFKDYCNQTFLLPSLEQQQQIVSVLDKISLLIDKRKKQLTKLDELVKSRFVEMFGEVITNSNGYELKKYGDFFELNAGGTPSKGKKEYWDKGSISWIGSNMCQNTFIYKNDGNYITEEGLRHSSARLFPVDTVLIALVGATIGKTALLKFETTTNQNVLGIRGIRKSGYTPEFVYYYTQGLYPMFLNLGEGGFAMASKKFISLLPIPIVELGLQNQFADFVNQIEKLKSSVQKSLESLETLKKAQMQKYFG